MNENRTPFASHSLGKPRKPTNTGYFTPTTPTGRNPQECLAAGVGQEPGTTRPPAESQASEKLMNLRATF